MVQRASSVAEVDASLVPMLPWFNAATSNMLALQQVQMETVAAWQQAVAAMQQELWDEWISRWGGGVPIDR